MVTPIKGYRPYLLLISYLATLAVAQVPSPTTSVATVQTHAITVGNGDHKFRPEVTLAGIGDIIEFQFFPPNHSVVRAEYQYPCIPYEMTGQGKVGFFSGFHPVDAILAEPPKWRVTINDTNPVFFYCSAVGSCINYQMVGVINPNASVSLANQKLIASRSSYMLQPGDSFPGEGNPSSSSSLVGIPIPTSTPASTPSSSTIPTTTTSPSAAPAPTSHSALSTGAIVGIAIAGVAILALAAALFFFIGRSKTLKQEVDRRSTRIPPQSPRDMHHTYLAPKSEAGSNMSWSWRNSAGPYGQDASEPIPEYTYHGAEVDNVQTTSTMTSPGANTGHGRSNANVTNSRVPLRHPSVLLNPNAPTELHAPDTRY